MAEQENCVRVTRLAARKRAAEETLQRSTNKRVVLGEIQNVLGLDGKSNGVDKKKTRPKTKRNVRKGEKAFDSNVEEKSDDPQMCATYASDIYQYLHKMENEPSRRPSLDYIEKVQRDVSANMRGILVDWLVEVNIGDFGLAVMKCVMLDLKLQGIRAGGNSDFSDEMGKELSQMSVAAGLRFLNRAALKSLEEFGIEGSMISPWKRCCYSCPW